MSVTLAVDAMGGDLGVTVTIPACCDFLQSHPDAMVIVVGDPKLLNEAIKQCNAEMLNRFQIIAPLKLF